MSAAILLRSIPLIVICLASTLPALSQERAALVIGNGDYQTVTKLKNPKADAEDMAAALRGLGFSVELLKDANLGDMEAAVIRLGNRLGQSRDSWGFVYYAGHAVQSDGVNYLIPVDASIAGEAFLKTKALAAQSILDTLQRAGNGLNIIVLDACRDNPYSWARSGTRGLSVVGFQPPGSIIAYATSAGSVAQDGDGRNGLFTGRLLAHLSTPGLDIKEVFDLTGADVMSASGNRQVPAIYSQLFRPLWLAGEPVSSSRSGIESNTAPGSSNAESGDALAQSIPRDGLVSEWLFDGTARDSVKRRPGQIVDLSFGKDRFGRDNSAAYFNGLSSCLDAGPVFSGSLSEWSVSLWYYTESVTRNGKYFVQSPLLSNWNRWEEGAQKGWLWGHAFNPGEDQAGISLVTCDGKIETLAGSLWSEADEYEAKFQGRWAHGCLVVRQGTAYLYLDGAAPIRLPASAIMQPDLDAPLWFGRSDIDRGDDGVLIDFFHGALDDIRLYGRALTEEEVLALFDEEPAPPKPLGIVPVPRNGLASEWLFEGNTRDSAKRRIGAVVDVTLGRDRFGRDRAAAYFNGTSSRIDAGQVFEGPTPNWSVSLWYFTENFYRPASGVYLSPFLSNWNHYVEGAQRGFDFGHFMNIDGGDAGLRTTVCDGSIDSGLGANWTKLPSYEREALRKWTHVCLVVADGMGTIYFNGGKAAVGKVASPLVPDPESAFWIGFSEINKEPTGDGNWRDINWYQGSLDDIRIYNRSLGEDEVLALFDETRNPK